MRAGLVAVTLVTALASLFLGCSRVEPEPKPRREPEAAAAPSTSAGTATPAANGGGPLVLARGVRMVHAGAGADAAKVVRDERERARADGRDLVVYVGARWCEPCQHFHKAAQAGDLDGAFPDLTLLEFDLDEDRERLAPAGYVSQFIPLFVMPDSDGRASKRKFEGAVTGPAAVANITPRLRDLLKK